jgi:hypothetical protein
MVIIPGRHQAELFGITNLPPLVPPWVGKHPMDPREGRLIDAVAHGLAVPQHPSTCASVPGCWHGQVWHAPKTRDHACMVPGCQCLAFVSQRLAREPGQGGAARQHVPVARTGTPARKQ